MEKIFEDIKKTFSRAAGKFAKKSGEVLEVSKLTLAISAANSDIKEEYEKIGRIIYEGREKNDLTTEELNAHFEAIDGLLAKIGEYRQKLNEIKNVRVCPVCGAELSKDSTFCAKCGEKL
ncbi:MAG: Rad50 zinc hook motif protein [Firmicutes bacterium ADurb.Bin193]|nr:MAG: Rad50 zinc hook motif protein [Firmicutes bacterium ADurb.Bin193]